MLDIVKEIMLDAIKKFNGATEKGSTVFNIANFSTAFSEHASGGRMDSGDVISLLSARDDVITLSGGAHFKLVSNRVQAIHKLRASWSVKERDILLHWPEGSHTKADAAWLSGIFNKEFIDELTRRGYDVTTLRFSVSPVIGNQRFTSQQKEVIDAKDVSDT